MYIPTLTDYTTVKEIYFIKSRSKDQHESSVRWTIKPPAVPTKILGKCTTPGRRLQRLSVSLPSKCVEYGDQGRWWIVSDRGIVRIPILT